MIAAVLMLGVGAQMAGAAPPKIKLLSTDPFTNPDSQHQTQVEPETFSYGNTVVAAYQSGRFHTGGGSSGIGYAMSPNRGRTWITGFLPGLTANSTPPGPFGRATDVSVAYDATNNVWLISSYTLDPPAMVVARSTDGGLTFSSPITVYTPVVDQTIDKDWIVCDNGARSPFKGTCYLAWTDVTPTNPHAMVSRSTDGGFTWISPVNGSSMLGVQPVVRPNGDLIIVGIGPLTMDAIRSVDGGATLQAPVVVSNLMWRRPSGIRNLPLPSVEVDGAGRVYVAWQDCRFRSNCTDFTAPSPGNDIVIKSSADGVTWFGVPVRVPLSFSADHIVPGIGVDPATSGSKARVGLTFYELPQCDTTTCRINAGFIWSTNGGGTWSVPNVPLNAVEMEREWLPDTSSGRMLADYLSTSVTGRLAVTVIPVASAPDTQFHQSTFTYRQLLERPHLAAA